MKVFAPEEFIWGAKLVSTHSDTDLEFFYGLELRSTESNYTKRVN